MPVVETGSVQSNMAYFFPWLQEGTRAPFVLVGPQGSGKVILFPPLPAQ